MLVIGPPSSGKSQLIKDLIYYNKHKYPVVRAWCGSETFYKEMCEIIPPLYVSNGYDETEIKSHILRQRNLSLETDTKNPDNAAIMVLDDCCNDRKIWKTPLMRSIFKSGSQHYNQMAIVGTQACMDLPDEIRKSASYVVIFKFPNKSDRERLYKQFGGIAGSYQEFEQIMTQLTGDYTCMVIDQRTQSGNREDCIFYFRTKLIHKDWKAGAKEYHQNAKQRYNRKYKDVVDIDF
jgi:hypothetical protein